MDEEKVKAIVGEMKFWTGKGEMAMDEIAMIQPGLARIMAEIGNRTWKLYYAAEAGNWKLAIYMWKETKKAFEIAQVTRPKHEEAIEEYLRDDWSKLEGPMKDENFEAFKQAFDEAIDSANAWHEKKDKPYIIWKLPDHPPPDLDLKPRK